MARVVIVGLGPGPADLVTSGAIAAIERVPRRFLRTGRHPSASIVDGATALDHLYESEATFADVYARITDALVAAAAADGEILYAVPGSPWVLERTVEL